jgi:hypothetical protein
MNSLRDEDDTSYQQEKRLRVHPSMPRGNDEVNGLDPFPSFSPADIKPRVKAPEMSPRRATIEKLSSIASNAMDGENDFFYDAQEEDSMDVDSNASAKILSVIPISDIPKLCYRVRDPLRAAESVVEFLENISPGALLCQVMSINLAMAYYALYVSAREAVCIPQVRSSLHRLRQAIEVALVQLTDVANFHVEESQFERVEQRKVRSETHACVSACESACTAMAQSELLIARALSILNKAPSNFQLVDALLNAPAGSFLHVEDESSQRALLDYCRLHQPSIAGKEILLPSSCEYVLRNTDNSAPCQLCVKRDDLTTNTPAILVALTVAKRI